MMSKVSIGCLVQTLRLRGILEWRNEVTSGSDQSGSSESAEVMILIWPAGEFKRLPRGTTASEIVRDQVRSVAMKLHRNNVQ